MIIIEGPDLVGKTTLAHELVERMNKIDVMLTNRWTMHYAHMSKPPVQWDMINGYRNRMNRFAVQDRFHYGRIAYAKAAKQSHEMDPMTCWFIEGQLRMFGAVIVVITASPEFLTDQIRTSGRSEMYDEEVIRKANEHFLMLGQKRVQCANPDLHHHLVGQAWPSRNENLISDIIELWLQRQLEIIERVDPCYRICS